MKFFKQNNSDSLDLDDKILLINIRNQLAMTELNTMKKLYCNKDSYKHLLNNIKFVLNNDRDYLLFWDIIAICQDLINYGRLNFDTRAETRGIENSIIIELNELSNMEEEQRLEHKKEYLLKETKLRLPESYHAIKRKLKYDLYAVNDYSEIIKLVAYDSILLYELNQKTQNPQFNIDIPVLSFLSSTRYFLGYTKELYRKNPKYVKITQDYLDLVNSTNIYKEDINKIQKRLNRINK